MAQLKHIPNDSILGKYSHDKVTPVNPTTCQIRESKHCTLKTATLLILNDGNKGYKIDKSSERFGV